MSHLGQRTNQAEKTRPSIDTTSLGTVSRFSRAGKSRGNISKTICVRFQCSKQFTVNKIRTFSFWHQESRESNSERKLAKICTIWLWLFAGPGAGGRHCCSPILLDSSDFWEVEMWKLKIFHEDPRTVLEYSKQITFFEPVPSGIETTPTHFTLGNDTYNRGV